MSNFYHHWVERSPQMTMWTEALRSNDASTYERVSDECQTERESRSAMWHLFTVDRRAAKKGVASFPVSQLGISLVFAADPSNNRVPRSTPGREPTLLLLLLLCSRCRRHGCSKGRGDTKRGWCLELRTPFRSFPIYLRPERVPKFTGRSWRETWTEVKSSQVINSFRIQILKGVSWHLKWNSIESLNVHYTLNYCHQICFKWLLKKWYWFLYIKTSLLY